jgi:FkbM family methyltransferase
MRRYQRWLSETDSRDNAGMNIIMAAVLRHDANVIDIGALSGEFLADALRLAPEGRHIAYEPQPEFVEKLKARFPGVVVRRAAVCDENGESSFAQVANGPGWSGLRPYGIGTETPPEIVNLTVPTVRLDDDLPAGYVPDLIKVDVNGGEAAVFRSALRTLKEHRPTVLFEHGQAASAYGSTAGEIHELLHGECGLEVFDLSGNGPLTAEEFERAARTRWNWLARAR